MGALLHRTCARLLQGGASVAAGRCMLHDMARACLRARSARLGASAPRRIRRDCAVDWARTVRAGPARCQLRAHCSAAARTDNDRSAARLRAGIARRGARPPLGPRRQDAVLRAAMRVARLHFRSRLARLAAKCAWHILTAVPVLLPSAARYCAHAPSAPVSHDAVNWALVGAAPAAFGGMPRNFAAVSCRLHNAARARLLTVSARHGACGPRRPV